MHILKNQPEGGYSPFMQAALQAVADMADDIERDIQNGMGGGEPQAIYISKAALAEANARTAALLDEANSPFARPGGLFDVNKN